MWWGEVISVCCGLTPMACSRVVSGTGSPLQKKSRCWRLTECLSCTFSRSDVSVSFGRYSTMY